MNRGCATRVSSDVALAGFKFGFSELRKRMDLTSCRFGCDWRGYPATGILNMRLLKRLIVAIGILASGLFGGGFVGFAMGYVITGREYYNPYGGALLVAMLMFGGAILGLIAGAVIAYWRS